MSRDRVEFVRSAIAAFNDRDFDGMRRASHEDLEFVSVLSAVDAAAATYRGADAWVEYFAVMDDLWTGLRMEAPRLFDASDDLVVSMFALGGEGLRSGARVEREVGMAYTFRDDKLWRLQSYQDPLDALDAGGLRREAGVYATIILEAVGAFNGRGEEEVLHLIDPDAELHSALLERGVYRGYDGLAQYRRDLDDAWGDWKLTDDYYVDAGPGRLLQLYRGVGIGRGSGIPVERDIGTLWTFRDGRIVRADVYLDHAEAIAAAGSGG